jgi:DNA polymerase-3 subunit chi
MTEIDFYVLKPQARGDRFGLACRLIEKAYTQQRRVFVYTGSTDESGRMDRLLWTFRDGSFIPHGLIRQVDSNLTPVLISHQDDPGDEHDVLLNLSNRMPPFFSRFSRLLETLDQTPALLSAGRERFRHYKQRGYPLRHHDIT